MIVVFVKALPSGVARETPLYGNAYIPFNPPESLVEGGAI